MTSWPSPGSPRIGVPQHGVGHGVGEYRLAASRKGLRWVDHGLIAGRLPDEHAVPAYPWKGSMSRISTLIFLPVRVANDVVSPFFKPRIALPRGAFSG